MSAPDRIYIDRGPKGGWMHRDKRMPDTVAEYVRLDPNTRVVTVDQLEQWEMYFDESTATRQCLEIGAIIGKVHNDRKDDPFIDYPNIKVLSDYSGSDARAKRVSEEIRAIIVEVK